MGSVAAAVSVPRRGSADGATNLLEASKMLLSEVSVPRRGSADGATIFGFFAFCHWGKVSVPRRGSADGATQHNCVLNELTEVSVPRRGSADGATGRMASLMSDISMFQSPEGEVLTVQHNLRQAVALEGEVSVPRRGSADGATQVS